jgi:lysophospholipase L1-like esterase
VRLTNTAVIGAESSGLELQLANALDQVSRPHVAIIMIGANDVTHRIDKSVAVRHLETTVQALRELGTEVVVGTCPDLGTIQPIPQPLRLIGRRWSRDLAAAQTVAVVEAGGRTVSLGDLLGPEFYERPHEMFSADRFHPSPAGYARAAAALLPSVYAALGVWAGEPTEERHPDMRRGEGVGPVAVAAEHAVRDPGTEVSATQIAGQSRGPRGRWAMLLRRPHKAVPDPRPSLAVDGHPIDGEAAHSERSESKATPLDATTRHTIEAD